MNRERLDFRFQSECPACGDTAGWTGVTTADGDRLWIELACPRCHNRFDELNPAWEAIFAAAPPVFQAGA